MSISLTSILQRITGSNTFWKGPNASRENGVVLEDSATVTWSTDGFGNIQATASGGSSPTGPANEVLATPNGSSGTAALRALVSADLPVGSASQAGAVKVDGTTITATAGVISAIGGGALTLISKQVLVSPAATVTFSAIPQTFTNLKIVISASASSANGFNPLQVQFNADTAGNYSWQEMFGSGTTPGAANGGSATSAKLGNISDTTSTLIGAAAEVSIPNYAGTVFDKTLISFTQGAQTAVISVSGWASTSAITQIELLLGSGGNFVVGSTFCLYGY